MYVGTSELHFCSPHWIQKYMYLNLKKKNCQPVQNLLILYYPHAYPPPILFHPMHALPLFCPTPCMPSPYSVPPHAYPPPILSHHTHALPLFCPSHHMHALPLFCPAHACPPPILSHTRMPSPYSIPPHAYLPTILSHPMHTLPLFYPNSCTPSHLFYPSLYKPSSYSILPHTCPPLILSHCMHVLSCSLPAHTCHPSILFQLMHTLLTPCHMNLEGMFLLWHLRMPLLNLLTLSISSSFTLLSNLKHQFINLWHLNVCCFHSHELTTLNSSTH